MIKILTRLVRTRASAMCCSDVLRQQQNNKANVRKILYGKLFLSTNTYQEKICFLPGHINYERRDDSTAGYSKLTDAFVV